MDKFRVSEAVSHPKYGAGVISGIRKKFILGKNMDYYVLKLPMHSLQEVLIPVNNAKQIGLHKTMTEDSAKEVLELLKTEDPGIEEKDCFKARFKKYSAVIKEGDIKEISKLLKKLHRRKKEKLLGANEMQLFDKAYQIVSSEVMYALDKSSDEIYSIMDEVLL